MRRILLCLIFFLTAISLFAQNKIVGGYYTNWSVYSRNFGIADLAGTGITEITQAFMFPFVVDGSLSVGDEVVYRGTSKTAVILTCRTFTNDDGVTRTTGVASTDFYADLENVLSSVTHYGSPSWLDGATNAEKLSNWIAMSDDTKPGVMGQFIKAKNNGIEIVASLGGWTLAQHFPEIAKDIKTRAAFAEAVAEFATTFKYDGIDLDWEFPLSGGTDGTETIAWLTIPEQPHYTEDPMNMVMLCKAIRQVLAEDVKLSVCTNQNPFGVSDMYIFPGNKSTWSSQTYKGYDGSDLTDWVDRFYTMTYDYGGSWLSTTSHSAPLYNSGNANDPDKDMSVSAFIDVLIDNLQVPASMIVMGVPFYGRGWSNVVAGSNGDGLFQASSQASPIQGSWDDTAGENSAAFDYGDLKSGKALNAHQYIKDGVGTGNNGFIEYWDDVCKVPYLYNASTGTFISYDNPASIAEKVKVAMNKGLAGVFTWEYSQDDSDHSLTKAMVANAVEYNVVVSGKVHTASNQGISGVIVALSGGDTKQTTTGSDGTFTFTVKALKDYSLSFTKTGYVFKPTEVGVEILEKDTVINVAGSSSAYMISGNLAFSGGSTVSNVELNLKSGTNLIESISCGTDGNYLFSDVPGEFDYQLIPVSSFYQFSPSSYTYSALSSNKTSQDFTVSYQTYAISGIVSDRYGNPVVGATVVLSGAQSETVVTGSDGSYYFSELQGESDYQVSIEIDDIYYVTKSVDASELSGNVTINFSEYQGIAVFGYVKNGTTAVSGATVAMTNDWQTNWIYNHSATTDANGFYEFVMPESVTSVTSFTLSPSSGTYYSSVDIPSSLSSSLHVDFNTQQAVISLSITSPLDATITTGEDGKITLTADASVSSGSIYAVNFEVDGQTLSATNTSGSAWSAEWTPSEVFTDYTVKATATANTGSSKSATKEVYVDCNTNCPNQKPIITLNSPSGDSESQESFSPVEISAAITDEDGTIQSVIFTINGTTVTPVNSGDNYTYTFTPSAYQTYVIEIQAIDDESGAAYLTKNYEIKKPSSFTALPDVAIIGYWQNWQNNSAPFIPLSSLLSSNYTIIIVAFGIQESTVEDYLVTFTPDATGYPDVQDFKDDVVALQAAGKPVLLSLGGETGHFSSESEEEKNAFVNGLKNLIDEYGFDGIDVDFEGVAAQMGETSTSLEYSTLTSARSKYLIDALGELVDYYGDDFILAFAEELYYVQVGYNSYPGNASGDFLPVLYNLWDKWDLLNVQYYNYGSEWWMGADKQETYSAELVTQELELLLTGFTLGNTGNKFPAIEPSRLTIGLPCTCSASGTAGVNDYNVSIDDMIDALEYLRTGVKPSDFAYTTKGVYESIRGMMTWSINWDATTDCGHTPYDFADRYYEYFSGLANVKPTVSITSPEDNDVLSPGTVTITATASDNDGSVARVDFYVDDILVGSDDTSPYSYSWQVSNLGEYALYAVAVDNKGEKGNSEEITVQIVEQGAPSVTLTSPSSDAKILPGVSVVLTANATDEDGTISKVEFYDGSTLIGTITSSPYTYTWSTASPGTHAIKAIVTDNDNKTAVSAIANITVYAYYTISGTITRSDGAAYSGVAVSLVSSGQTTRYAETDGDGAYTFENVLSFNDYTLIPSSGSSEIFDPEEIDILNLSADATADFSLYEGVYVHGYVKSGTTPVAGAVVQVVLNYSNASAPWTSETVSTDFYGYYRYSIPDEYINGAGGTVKMNSWDNSSTTYYPSSGYTFSTYSESQTCDFNSQENTITIDILTNASVDVESGSSVTLQANASITSGNVESVVFSIDEQTLAGSNISGDVWEATWTPSALDDEYVLTVTATGEGIISTKTSNITVICTGSGCSNKQPIISLISPSKSSEQQETFSAVAILAEITDEDGTVSGVTITVDEVSQQVSRSGDVYSCIFVPTSYKSYSIVVTAIDDDEDTSSLTKEYTIKAPSTFTPFPSKCITGYWHNWENSSAPFIPLKNVLNTKFNVVNISFIETENSDGYTPVFEPLSTEYPEPEMFKEEVAMLQAAGIPVLISIGGQNGHVVLSDEAKRDIFVNGVIAICEEYGFDGIDIDYEGSSMTAFNPPSNSLEYADITDPELKYGIDAIREIHDYFGDGFIITAAPETAYVQDGRLNYPASGQFLPVLYNIRDILTCLHVQLYNFGSATWSHLQNVSGTPSSLSAGTADVIVGLTEMLVTGFPLGSSGLTFPGLNEDQVAIGLIASPSAGGSIHYIEPDEVKKALNYLIKGEKDVSLTYPLQVNDKYPDIRGMMTWSINWDAVQDGRASVNEFADTYYEYFWGQEDTDAPVINAFSCDSYTSTGTVNVKITATDNIAITGYYMVADESLKPDADFSGWGSTKPTSITLPNEGSHILYLWVKDAAGNISAVKTSTVVYDKTSPIVSISTEQTTVSEVNIDLSVSATDNVGVTGYCLRLNESSTPELNDSDWTTTEPSSITLPDEEGSYIIYLWAKDGAGNISSPGQVTVNYQIPDQHFIPVWSGDGYNKMYINIAKVSVDDEDLVAGDEIGVFDGDLCVGAGVLPSVVTSSNYLNIVVSANDGSSSGYDEGDEISYRVYRKSLDEEISICSAVYSNDESTWVTSGNFQVGGISVVSLSCDYLETQELNFPLGWSVVSLSVIPDDQSIESIFESAMNNGRLTKIISQDGSTLENSEVLGGWKNSIGEMNSTEGYLVNANEAFSITVTGNPIELPFDIPLKAGWNIIAFTSTSDIDCSKTFNTLIEDGCLLKVMDGSGQTLEDWGSLGGWVNNIGYLENGQGYRVRVSESCTLKIEKEETKSLTISEEILSGTYFNLAYQGQGFHHMQVHVVDLVSAGLQVGDEIGVFDGDICVGSVLLDDAVLLQNRVSIACSENDSLSDQPDGFTIGNPITMRAYGSGVEYNLLLNYLGENSYFEGGESVFVTLEKEISTNIVDIQNIGPVTFYPNPFTNEIWFKVRIDGIKMLNMNIYDMAGKEIRRLYNGKPAQSELVVKWDGRTETGRIAAPGVYLCKINNQLIRIIKKNE